MKDNPYSKMLKIMSTRGSKFNPPNVEIGVVVQEPPNLIVKIRDLEIDNDNILIADYLLKEYERKIKFFEPNAVGETTVSGTHSHPSCGGGGEHSHPLQSVGVNIEMYTQCTLRKDDLVAVMPTYDRQTYIVFARLTEVK